jgi:hypothetical protein
MRPSSSAASAVRVRVFGLANFSPLAGEVILPVGGLSEARRAGRVVFAPLRRQTGAADRDAHNLRGTVALGIRGSDADWIIAGDVECLGRGAPELAAAVAE